MRMPSLEKVLLPINPPQNPNGGTLNQVKYAIWILQGQVWLMMLELRGQARSPVVRRRCEAAA